MTVSPRGVSLPLLEKLSQVVWPYRSPKTLIHLDFHCLLSENCIYSPAADNNRAPPPELASLQAGKGNVIVSLRTPDARQPNNSTERRGNSRHPQERPVHLATARWTEFDMRPRWCFTREVSV